MEVSIVKQDRLALDAVSADSIIVPSLRPNFIDRLYSRFLKRTLDICGAIFLLVLLSPVFFIVTILIMRDSHGGIIFRQTRVGRHGQPFTCYKFRSMVVDAEYILQHDENLRAVHAALWKISNDPRVTRVGKMLRRTSLDELPQLINVLKGEMSLVGPRPYLPKEMEGEFSVQAPQITKVRPGITGLWQVSGRSHLLPKERVDLDRHYTTGVSLKGDAWIVLRTLRVVIMCFGAH